MTPNPILTIGIPTYNGATFLREALDSIANQMDAEMRDRIEILVSDNASTDGTGDVVRRFERDHGIETRYFRNEQNVGYDANVDLLFKRATGEFVWMLGDDDTLKPHAIMRVRNIISAHPELCLLQVNYDQLDRTLTMLVHQEHIPESTYCTDPETFLLNARHRYALLSALIIRRDTWNAIDVTGGLGSLFMHIYAMYRILPNGPSFIEQEALINMRMHSPSSHASGDTLLSVALASEELAKSLEYLDGYHNISKKFISDARKYTNGTVVIAKLKGISDKRNVARKLLKLRHPLFAWLWWTPLLYIPDRFFSFSYHIKKRISSKTRIIEKTLKQYLKRNR